MLGYSRYSEVERDIGDIGGLNIVDSMDVEIRVQI